MAETKTTTKPDPFAQVISAVDEGNKTVAELKTKVAELEKKLSEPNRAPWVTSGPVGADSQPYSILKAAAFCLGELPREQVKSELDIHERLKGFFTKHGWAPTKFGNSTFLMPHNSQAIPDNINGDDTGYKLRLEIRQKMMGSSNNQIDPDEMAYLRQKQLGLITKTPLGTINDTAGGVLVGFPTLMELIDIQRNLEVFPNAGSTEIGLPPNGRAQFPKLTGGATAYWVGEAQSIAESAPTTGYLDLVAKKLGILVKMNNELIRYASPTAEGMVRLDMSRVAARKADLGMLSGTGGTQIKGLITYPTQSDWTFGNDSLIVPAALTGGGTLLTGPDINLIENLLPDMVGEGTAWVMRRALWAKILNFRADAITTGDAAGPFLYSRDRGLAENMKDALVGTKVVKSSQISKTRSNGNETGGSATYLLYGYFPDWIIARFGVMEFLATTLGDTAFVQDQTWLRGIQLLDAGPRHAASFVFVDGLTNSTT